MTYVTGKMNEDKVPADSFSFAVGRGKFISGLPCTLVRGTDNVDSTAFGSTRIPGHAASSTSQGDTHSGLPATTDPALNNLITHIFQQVG